MAEVVVLKPIKTERRPEPEPLPPDLPDYPEEAYLRPTFWELLRQLFFRA